MQKTTLRQNVTNADRTWFQVDGSQHTLGKLATKIAVILRGKHRRDFTPHVDGGDYVVVLNADQIRVTGAKEGDKKYFRHSGHKGNLKEASLSEVRSRTPKRILFEAVKGMLPKNKLRNTQLTRLKLIVGDENPHAGQDPETLTV